MLSLAITIIISSTANAEDVRIVRTLSTTEPIANSEFAVTLNISGTDVAGIVESMPEGFSYVGTSHPETQTSQSKQKIVFSVIGETEITYRVKAPSSGSGTFTGTWYTPLDEAEGTIPSTVVTVKPDFSIKSEAQPQESESKNTPFLSAVAVIAIISLLAYCLREN
ncbi:hypothetical protein [Methanosarcina siciliae]|uniref:hypothetical protein n=1 Tax=Methanosarcina siciliae TaxID=38027 RepID=UPI000697A9C0|nr:hypothetical protein [Methanosarcina siciliae]